MKNENLRYLFCKIDLNMSEEREAKWCKSINTKFELIDLQMSRHESQVRYERYQKGLCAESANCRLPKGHRCSFPFVFNKLSNLFLMFLFRLRSLDEILYLRMSQMSQNLFFCSH